MVKIVITGPENSGKTTLARELSKYYSVPWVPEYAREYLESRGGRYDEEDLLHIARGQVAQEDTLARSTDLLICDTSLEVIKIWSTYRYGRCHEWILHKVEERKPALYLLCRPDLPWVFDPLRENPHDREQLFQLYIAELRRQGVPYVEIGGQGQERLDAALAAVAPLWPDKGSL